MKLAITFAETTLGGWITSCLSCLSLSDGNESSHPQHAMRENGVEREMKVCHSQPHLIPPMRLVLYDDLPSPGMPPSRRASFHSWIAEGKHRMSRISNRTAISLSSRRKIPAAYHLRISAPMDFRREYYPLPACTTNFRPLELSIHTPGNRLSELPTFEDFHVEGELPFLTCPSRVFSPTVDRWQRNTSPTFRIPRKPLGYGSNCSSLAGLEHLLKRQQHDLAMSPLIPHFSTRIQSMSPSIDWPVSFTRSIAAVPSLAPAVALDSMLDKLPNPEAPSTSRTPIDADLLDQRPFAPLLDQDDSPPEPQPTTSPISPADSPRTLTRSSSLVSRWLLSSGNKGQQPPCRHGSSSGHMASVKEGVEQGPGRSRTLSYSTVSSYITYATSAGRPTPSLYSAITTATTVQTSVADVHAEKEYELAISELPVASVFGSRPIPAGVAV